MSLQIAPCIVARFDHQHSSAAALCPNRCAQLFHLHGVGDGERVAHCITNYPDPNPPDYQLRHATELTARVGDGSVAEAMQLL